MMGAAREALDVSSTSHPLTSLLRPRSIAFVGATERSIWTRAALANITTLGYSGKLHLVNRKGGEVLGIPAVTSLREIDEPVDVALVMVPSEALLETIRELGAAGVRNAVLLSAGFAEAGAKGRELQQELKQLAREHRVSLLGPNCLGFVNFVAATPVWTVGLRRHAAVNGKIAIISQSGALAAQMSYFSQSQGIALTYMVSTGNEVDVDIARVIDYLVDEPATRAVALFLETVRDVPAFSLACLRALEAGKPIVVLKVGSSEVTARSAQTHTGSLVGDDRVFDAACRRLGLVRVSSLEDLIITTEVLARTGRLGEGGLGLMSISGGLCEIAADRAAVEGVALPALSPATATTLAAVLPDFGTPQNPLDITGGALLNPALLEQSLGALSNEPRFSAVVSVLDVPSAPGEDSKVLRQLLAGVGAAQARCGRPSLLFSHTVRPFGELSQEIVQASGCNYLPCGIHHGISAMARAFEWSKLASNLRPRVASSTAVVDVRPSSEREVLEYLSSRGVPTVPAMLATTSDQAVAFARQLGEPVALKIISPDIAHKSELGGVALSVTGDDAVAHAFEQILARVQAAAPHADVEGISVAPMRGVGIELFVGTMRDPQWGTVISVGLGGVWVEALRDTSLRLLPVSADEVLDMFDELRGHELLNGFRGGPAVNRPALASAIVAIGDAALALGPRLLSLEINPLLASGERIEALDGWAEWNAPA